MPLAWFIVPYKRRNPGQTPAIRYPAIDDFTEQIRANGGDWSETEILGDCALVKVRATASIILTLIGQIGFFQIPNHWILLDLLSDLTNGQKNQLNTQLLNLGYVQSEIDIASGGDWGTKQLLDLLNFIATRRLKPRYDASTDSIILDGIAQPTRTVLHVDRDIDLI